MNLPGISIKYYVSSIRRILRFRLKRFLLNTYYPIPNTSQGFALIPVIVLLLFGIAAGTILIRNGLNFIPKADNSQRAYAEPTIGTQGVPLSCPNGKAAQYCEWAVYRGWTCNGDTLNGCSGFNSGNPSCSRSQVKATSIGKNDKEGCFGYVCADPNYPDAIISDSGVLLCYSNQTAASCNPPRESQENSCEDGYRCYFDFIRDPDDSCKLKRDLSTDTSAGHCDRDSKCESVLKCENNELHKYNKVTGELTTKFANCGEFSGICQLDTSVICRSAQDEAECRRVYGNDYTIESGSGKCIKKSGAAGPDECKASESGTQGSCGAGKSCELITGIAKCITTQKAPTEAGEIPAKQCSSAVKNKCREELDAECYNVGEKGEKCVLPSTTTKCNTTDTDYCIKPPDARTGCEIKSVTIVNGSTKIPIKYSQCTAAQAATAPAAVVPAGGPAAVAPAKSASGTQPTSTNQTSSQGQSSTQVPCGTDANGLNIPCYAIGSFTPENLAATEADAKIALTRYDEFNKILSDVKGKINNDIAAVAQKKLDEAKAKASACIAK